MPLQYKIEYRMDELTDRKVRKLSKNSVKRPAPRFIAGSKPRLSNNASPTKGSKVAHAGPPLPNRTLKVKPAGALRRSMLKTHIPSADGLSKVMMPAGCCVYYHRGAGVPLSRVDPQLARKTTKAGQKELGLVDPVSNKQHKVAEEEYGIIREVVENYLEKQANEGNNGADNHQVGSQSETECDRPSPEKPASNLAPSHETTQKNAEPTETPEASSNTTDPTAINETISSQAAVKNGRRCLLPISKATQPHGSPSGPFLVEGQGARAKEQPEDGKGVGHAAQLDVNKAGSRSPGATRAQDVQQDRSAEGLLTVGKVPPTSGKDEDDKSEDNGKRNKSPAEPKTRDLVVGKYSDPVWPQVKSPPGGRARKVSSHRAGSTRDVEGDDDLLQIVSERSTLRDRTGTRSGMTNTRGEGGSSHKETTTKTLGVEGATKVSSAPAPTPRRSQYPPSSVEPKPSSFMVNVGRRGGELKGRGQEKGAKRGIIDHWQPVVSRHGIANEPPDPSPISLRVAQHHRTRNPSKLQPVEGRGYVTKMPSKVVLNVVLPREIKSRESKLCPRSTHSGGYSVSTGPQQHMQAWMARAPSPRPPPPPSAPSLSNKALDNDEDEEQSLGADQRPVSESDNTADSVEHTCDAVDENCGVLSGDGDCNVDAGDDEQQNVVQGRGSSAVSAEPGDSCRPKSRPSLQGGNPLPYVQASPPSWHTSPTAGKKSPTTEVAGVEKPKEHTEPGESKNTPTDLAFQAESAWSQDTTPLSPSSESASKGAGKVASDSPSSPGVLDFTRGEHPPATVNGATLPLVYNGDQSSTTVNDFTLPSHNESPAAAISNRNAPNARVPSPRTSTPETDQDIVDRAEGPGQPQEQEKQHRHRQYRQPQQTTREQPGVQQPPQRHPQPHQKQRQQDRKTSAVLPSTVYMAAAHCEILGPHLCKDCERTYHRQLFSAHQDLLYPSIRVRPRSLAASPCLKGDNCPTKEDFSVLMNGKTADAENPDACYWSYLSSEFNLGDIVTDLDIFKRVMAKGHHQP